MIEVYKASNTNYGMNGDKVIFPTRCEVEMTLRGVWELTLTHPVDKEGDFKLICEGNVICCPTPVGDRQLFRIYNKSKTDQLVTAHARPIFFDSAHDVFFPDTRPTEKTGQQALDILTGGTKYSGTSNITTVSTAYYIRKNLMEALQGDDENSFIARWGGEPIFDNYTVIINDRAGGDYGVRAEFGRNLEAIEETIDMDNVITRICPVSFNGHTLDGNTPWIDSPDIGKYPIVYTKEVRFGDVKLTEDCTEDETGFDTLSELRAELVRRCNQMFADGCGTPSVNYKVNMIDLSQTDEYKDYAILERVGIGDTIHCKHKGLGIETDERVIRITYDCIRKRNIELELGDEEYDYFDSIGSSVESIMGATSGSGWIRAEKIRGILDAINTQLRYQKNIAQKQDIRAILFEDTDPESSTYGAMCLGTQGFQIANKRTADGRDWDWTTAFTANGGYANALVAGLLADKTGRSYWDLDSGLIQLAGIFTQYNSDGRKSVEVRNNRVSFYNWIDPDDYVGSIGASKAADRAAITMFCDKGDRLVLGYLRESGGTEIIPVIRIDSSDPDNPLYIANTANGTIFGSNTNGGITVKNGLITDFSLKGAGGSITLANASGGKYTLTIRNGLIEEITSS